MSMRLFTTPLLLRFVGFALVLNGIWEFAQCPFLYEMRGLALGAGIRRIVLATLGDVVMAIAIVSVAALTTRIKSFGAINSWMWFTSIALGALTGAAIKWIAQAQGAWEYTSRMPILRVAGVRIGLVPVLQNGPSTNSEHLSSRTSVEETE